MPVKVVSRTNLNAVLTSLKARLMDFLSFPAERVLTLADDEIRPHTQADQVLLIRARTQRWDRVRDGAGRFDNRVKRRCTVTLQTRLLLDETTQDLEWLENATLGHYAREHQIFDALEIYILLDVAGNWLLYEPIHLEEAGAAEKPPKQAGWGQASYSFDLCFVLDLDQTRQ